MRLPEADRLHVEEEKVVNYLLNPAHKDGGSKAKFFKKRGFSPEQWDAFATALHEHGATQTMTSTEKTKHGQKFVVECQLQTPDGKNPCILSVWIKTADKPPRLVTAHPNS